MALTTSKFREDFELGSCAGVPPLDSPPLAAAMLMTHAGHKSLGRSITDLRAEMCVGPFKSRTLELLNL